MEHPVLNLGLTGFGPEQRATLAAAVAQQVPGQPSWRISTFWDADAWCVNGGKTQAQPDGTLRVLAGMPSEHAITLQMAEVNRPIAFATPLASSRLEPACTIDPESPTSVQQTLRKFENWLQPMLFRFAIGAKILERGVALRGNIYHLHHQSRLIAVLDFRHGKAAVLPTGKPIDLEGAAWGKRPVGAHDLPESFVATTPAQLIWTYVRHSGHDLLPTRYRTDMIYYRHVPRVPMGWLRDSMLQLLNVLSAEPANLQALRKRTGLAEAVLLHDLSCLYYAGAVTTTPMKAATTEFTKYEEPQPRRSWEPDDSVLGRSTLPPMDSGRTVPAMLPR